MIYYYPRSLYICRSTHMAETAKSYELTFEERPGYLFVKVKAERLEYYPAQGCLLEIAREMRGLRQTRLMIYRDVPSVMPRGQVFFISVKMAETFKDVKVVLVNPYPELDEDLNFAALLFHRRTSSG